MHKINALIKNMFFLSQCQNQTKILSRNDEKKALIFEAQMEV